MMSSDTEPAACVTFRERMPQCSKVAVNSQTIWWHWRRSGWSTRRGRHAQPSEKVGRATALNRLTWFYPDFLFSLVIFILTYYLLLLSAMAVKHCCCFWPNTIIVLMFSFSLSLSLSSPLCVCVVSLLKDLKHANIVTLHDIVHTDKSLTLVFEYLVRFRVSYVPLHIYRDGSRLKERAGY